MPNITWPKDGQTNLSKGIDLAADLALSEDGYSQKLDNFDYFRGVLRRRPALVDFNTNTLSGDSSNIIEYVDATGTARVISTNLDGKIQEVPSTGAISDRVTGLTASKRGSMAQFMGALFHQNGTDTPRRADGATWRVAGVPPATTLTLGAASGGALTGDYAWIVTACVRDATLGVVILESDWSNIIAATLAAQQQALSWTASGDTRVNWYRLYRVREGQGSPYYLVAEGNSTSYTDNITDAALSAQLADEIGVNGEMPKSSYVVACGQRLVCARLVASSTDPQAEAAFWVSRVSVNAFQMEAFPRDGLHKIYLPGSGGLTCAYPFSVKDEFQNAKDLFISQPRSCYILRRAEPNGTLETVSTEIGCIGQNAITQWSRYLFFISEKGLMFYSPEFGIIPIGQRVNSIFFGGGALGLSQYTLAAYYKMAVIDNRLVIAYTGATGVTNADRFLVMDLERFDPSNPVSSCYFTQWYVTGAELACVCASSSVGVLIADNAGRTLLKFDKSQFQDRVGDVQKVIVCEHWSGALFRGWDTWKTISRMNVIQLSDKDTKLDVFADYGLRGQRMLTISKVSVETVWDKVWDKVWGTIYSFVSTVALNQQNRGYIFQVRIKLDSAATDYGLFGYNFVLTINKRTNTGKI